MTDETQGSRFRRRLANGPPLLLDGGLGSLLIAKGLKVGEAPERWNLEHPERVREAHRGYVEAGSELIHTNTFGATPPKLDKSGLAAHQCAAVNEAAVRLAREATGDTSVLVAGDVGPTGELLPPMGQASEESLERAFVPQVEALAAAGADLLSIETMYDLREARAALAAALTTGLPVMVSMTFDNKRRGCFTIVGDRIGPSFEALLEQGAAAVGLNCTVESAAMVAMVAEATAAVSGPVAAQPNAGQPQATASGVAYPDADPERFAKDLIATVAAGARLVGGCCGTDPTFIRAARQALDALGAPPPATTEQGAR